MGWITDEEARAAGLKGGTAKAIGSGLHGLFVGILIVVYAIAALMTWAIPIVALVKAIAAEGTIPLSWGTLVLWFGASTVLAIMIRIWLKD
jgi:hypothetical protein